MHLCGFAYKGLHRVATAICWFDKLQCTALSYFTELSHLNTNDEFVLNAIFKLP